MSNKTRERSIAFLDGGKTYKLYFGPSAPLGEEGQRIKTISGNRWFVYFRIYGPEKSAFDGSWKPGDFEEGPSATALTLLPCAYLLSFSSFNIVYEAKP